VDFPQFDGGVRNVLRLDRERSLVATVRYGIVILSGGNGAYAVSPLNVEDGQALDRSIIKTMLVDRMDNLWIGTGTNGIFRLNLSADRFYRLFTASYDGGAFVRAFLKDSYGRLWIQTRQSPLRVVQGGVESPIAISCSDGEDNMVVGIIEDARRNVWLCAGSQLFQSAAGSDPRRPRNMATDPAFRRDIAPRLGLLQTLACDDKGTVWAGVWNGLLRIRPEGSPQRFMFYDSFDFQNSDAGIVDIFCDRAHGKLWACSRNYGLLMIDLDAQDDITGYTLFSLHGPQERQLSSNHVWSVVRASDGVVWVGTDNGLNSIKLRGGGEATVKRDSLPQRLMSDKILAIQEDGAGDLWLNTSDGLLRYTPADGTIRQYYARDGLSSSGLTEGVMRDKSGMIYVSTINGVTCFNPDEIRPSPYAPPVYLTGLKIFNRDVGVGEKIGGRVILEHSLPETKSVKLRYDQNNFTILFVGINFGSTARTIYSYKLESYDRDWITGPSRDLSASYNNLPAGSYRFRVKAANSDGVWSQREASMGVEIGVAPWLTWWAYALYVAIVFTMGYVIFKYYHRQQELKNNLYIEQLKGKHDRQMNEAREKFLANITHELRTPLTLITAPLKDLAGRLGGDPWITSRLDLIRNNTHRLLLLVNQFLDLTKIDSDNMRLNLAPVDVDLLASRVVDDFRMLARQKNISLSKMSEFSPITGLFDQDKVTKILFNLISNAIKFTPEGGSVSVILSPQEETLQVDVEDTGCGIAREELPKIFDRFYQTSGGSASGTGIGLSLVRVL